MGEGWWVRTIVMAIVIGNLIVLAKFFAAPRMQFFPAHTGLTKHLMETKGSLDMPNQLWQTYRVVNRIRELTPEDATIFMPPGDRMKGSFRSATIQVLYPRKIIFGDDENFASELKQAPTLKTTYFVYSLEWETGYCESFPRIRLPGFGFGMCRLENS